jgi:hypothetical protein
VVYDVGAQLVAHGVSIPNRSMEQTLHTLWPGLTDRLSQLPTILALNPLEKAEHVAPNPLAHFGAREARGNTQVNLRQHISPSEPLTRASPSPFLLVILLSELHLLAPFSPLRQAYRAGRLIR